MRNAYKLGTYGSQEQMKLIWLIIVVTMVFAAYVRLAPSDPGHWHVDPIGSSDRMSSGILAQMPADLADLNAAIMSSPRVRVLAGSVQDGHITYVARSKVWGFPDYISVKQVGSNIAAFSRQRFGSSDHGVNARRLLGFAEAIGLSPEEIRLESTP